MPVMKQRHGPAVFILEKHSPNTTIWPAQEMMSKTLTDWSIKDCCKGV
jgi:hypothetical protein